MQEHLSIAPPANADGRRGAVARFAAFLLFFTFVFTTSESPRHPN
jgi:hypothetical protein